MNVLHFYGKLSPENKAKVKAILLGEAETVTDLPSQKNASVAKAEPDNNPMSYGHVYVPPSPQNKNDGMSVGEVYIPGFVAVAKED